MFRGDSYVLRFPITICGKVLTDEDNVDDTEYPYAYASAVKVRVGIVKKDATYNATDKVWEVGIVTTDSSILFDKKQDVRATINLVEVEPDTERVSIINKLAPCIIMKE